LSRKLPSQRVWLSEAKDSLYSEIKETRHFVVFPWMVEAILQKGPASVMDYGAGDGRFLEALRRRFDGELWYCDPSASFLRISQDRLRANGIRICETLRSADHPIVDIVTSTAVWMTIPTYNGCLEYLDSQMRVLTAGGTALIAVTHPCFREEAYSSYRTSFTNERYRESGFPFAVSLFDGTRELTLTDHHWNLETMVQQANYIGFRIVSLTELQDVPSGNSRGSPWLCFELRKG
jgi:hypothetical protein